MNYIHRYLFAAIALLVLLTGVAVAQVSPNFNLSWAGFGSGGQRQSANYLIQDSLGQGVVGTAAGDDTVVEVGFLAGNAAPPAPTPTPTPTHTPTPLPNAPTPTPTPEPEVGGDAFEDDDVCARAKTLEPNNTVQTHTFHDQGDTDWIKFTAEANQSYNIQVDNTGPDADAVLFLHDSCAAGPSSTADNAFGNTVSLTWDATKSGDYYIKLQQFDAAHFGDDVTYNISITRDTTAPSSPTFPRCLSINPTTIGVQWKQNPERDVTRYRVSFANQADTFSGVDDVVGPDTTYYELTGLIPGDIYTMRVRALDFSGNVSDPSGEFPCKAQAAVDATQPNLTLQQPTASGVHTTTAKLLTFTGLATDGGNNLSRVMVKNVTKNVEKGDYSLSGGSKEFRVQDLDIGVGDNNIQITVHDDAGNTTTRSLLVRRLGDSPGAVLIIAGHNETFGLQTNIYNSTNRAYRIFESAGFSDDDIYYLAPVAQDADGDGTPETDGDSSPFNVEYAITTWAKGRVDADKPFVIYMMDHGLEDKFCASGCNSGFITPDELDAWLRDLEAATNVEITVVYEACVSGSFIHSKNGGVEDTISKAGRVIITSTGYNNNAYASAQGAYFSDAFFSCIADSGDLETCFKEAEQAVAATGVNQTPFLDDNGDRVYNSSDGSIARQRYITRFFSSIRPQITAVDVQKAQNNDGVLAATVTEGAETVELVWAAVYGPDFQEPDPQSEITLNLDVPVVRLEPDANQEGRFTVDYPNGFPEALDDYYLVFYAQDRLGINAPPQTSGEKDTTTILYLPVVMDQ